MDDLAQWYGAQLDAEAAEAQSAAEELGADWYYDDGFVLARREDDMVATGSQDFLERERGVFIARHDPARVLRDIDAKRAIVALHNAELIETINADGDERAGYWCAECDMQSFPCPTLRLLALPYSDRPGYREEWKP